MKHFCNKNVAQMSRLPFYLFIYLFIYLFKAKLAF